MTVQQSIVGKAQGYNYGVSFQFMVILGSIDEDVTMNAFTKTSCDTFLEYETLTTSLSLLSPDRINAKSFTRGCP